VFSRGDEKLSGVIEQAYRLGARFDEWSELFCFDRWMEAFDKEGIDPDDYLKERSIENPLPWEIIDTGVRREWLLEEKELSRRGDIRKDCRIIGCTGCGIFDCNIIPLREKAVIQMDYGRRAKRVHSTPVKIRYRIMYSKTGDLRFIGHLDITRALIRALKRAGLPLVYSQGYKPKPRVAFSPPLTLGFTSKVEYIDVTLERPLPDIEARLKRTLPDSFTINSVEIIPPKAKSLSSSLVLQRLFVEYYPSKVDEFMKKEVVEINAVNVRPAVLEIKKRNDGVEVLMKLGKVKPHQLFQALFNITKDEARLLKVERVGWE
jgi:radical SAM-linked protein